MVVVRILVNKELVEVVVVHIIFQDVCCLVLQNVRMIVVVLAVVAVRFVVQRQKVIPIQIRHILVLFVDLAHPLLLEMDLSLFLRKEKQCHGIVLTVHLQHHTAQQLEVQRQ